MSDRPPGGDSVVLVHVDFPFGQMQEDLGELHELARSAGAKIAAVVTAKKQTPEAKYFVGSGKAEEIRDVVASCHAKLVIFNHVLSPAQERNLGNLLQCRVLDRVGLILDIFAQRARSFEGQLQVELAQLKYLSTRLVRGWTHLERQRGGIGLRGPGETQLEVDRRLIRDRMKVIGQRLTKIRKQREQSRRARRKAIIPTVALVGYTNAGKSTLFNRLTGATVYTANQLFATLDPTLRRIACPQIGPVILADTVGFIRHLPPSLIEAFQATLEEVREADLILHVVDAHDENKLFNIEQVNAVLKHLQADLVPQLVVYNKIDLCPELSAHTDLNADGAVKRIFISATQALGLDELIKVIGDALNCGMVERSIVLTPKEGALRAKLYQRGVVVAEQIDEQGNSHLTVRMPLHEAEKLQEGNE
ncbi:MAG: GTPase HflX [Gammaproteobacteria bacterium RIFCSPHIGHO2_12_FULL_45_9]|nr:MAG: GTPase HflX [Gammaproteobacteria bacterium RIFCSPHIGHO2_12_FULL_45_9]